MKHDFKRNGQRPWLASWLCAALLALLLPGSALAQDNALVVPAGQQVQGNIATVQRDIVIDGSIEGDVTSWTGDIIINGSVSGDVVSYGGTITLGESARVAGSVLVLTSAIEGEARAHVAGQVIDRPPGEGALLGQIGAAGQPDTGFAGSYGFLVLAVLLVLLTLALAMGSVLVWPLRTLHAGHTLQVIPGRSLLLGLLTTALLACGLLLLAALLAVTLLGLPLLLLLAALLQVPYVGGLIILAQTLQQRISGGTPHAAARPYSLPLVTLGLLLPVILLSVLAPFWGLVLFYVLASPGLGALLLSRGGAARPLPAPAH